MTGDARSQPKISETRHSDLPWCIPTGSQNGFIICSGDNPDKPGPILMIVSKPKGRSYTLTDSDIADNTALMVAAANSHAPLKAALLGMVNMYVQLVESGDAGFWDAEKVPEVIAARAALEAKPAGGMGK